LNRPIVVNEANLVAARGAAMLAAIGSGLYPDYASAIENMTGAAQRVLPDAPLSTRYARLYDIYRELYPAMKDILHKLNESGVEPPKHASYSSVRPTAVIFSAGKIARGFIAHLLTLAGYDWFSSRNQRHSYLCCGSVPAIQLKSWARQTKT